MTEFEKFAKEIEKRYSHASWKWNGSWFSAENYATVGYGKEVTICYRYEHRHEELTVRVWQREYDSVQLFDEQSKAFTGVGREKAANEWLIETLFDLKQKALQSLVNRYTVGSVLMGKQISG